MIKNDHNNFREHTVKFGWCNKCKLVILFRMSECSMLS